MRPEALFLAFVIGILLGSYLAPPGEPIQITTIIHKCEKP